MHQQYINSLWQPVAMLFQITDHTDTGTKAITKLKYKFWSVKEDML